MVRQQVSEQQFRPACSAISQASDGRIHAPHAHALRQVRAMQVPCPHLQRRGLRDKAVTPPRSALDPAAGSSETKKTWPLVPAELEAMHRTVHSTMGGGVLRAPASASTSRVLEHDISWCSAWCRFGSIRCPGALWSRCRGAAMPRLVLECKGLGPGGNANWGRACQHLAGS